MTNMDPAFVHAMNVEIAKETARLLRRKASLLRQLETVHAQLAEAPTDIRFKWERIAAADAADFDDDDWEEVSA